LSPDKAYLGKNINFFNEWFIDTKELWL
jgi:hypothetical protein